MGPEKTVRSVLKDTSEIVRESAKLRERVWRCLSASAVIIDQSRTLLSSWPVSGIPAVSRNMRYGKAFDSHDKSHGPYSETPPSDRAETGSPLVRVEGQSFIGITVRLDGRHFVDCSMEHCVLEYWGGPVTLEGTQFSGCRFQFSGEAAMTVSVLDCFGMLERPRFGQPAMPAVDAGPVRVN